MNLERAEDETQIIMPMAGLGTRFQNVGVKTLKPTIQIKGIPMFAHAINCVANLNHSRKFAIILEEQESESHLSLHLKREIPDIEVKTLTKRTRGAAETVLSVEKYLQPDSPILIMDCDIIFDSTNFIELINSGEFKSFDGILLCFDSKSEAYSYVNFNENGIATQIVEKKVISNHAVAGAYFISKASDFMDEASKAVESFDTGSSSEIYVSTVISRMIENGLKFLVLKVDFTNLGTPEDLIKFDSSALK